MSSVAQSFDVKISIIRPYVTKNLSTEDLSKINQTTKLKYESLKTNAPQFSSFQNEEPSDMEILSLMDSSIAELDSLIEDFDDLSKKAEEAMDKIIFTYDPDDSENELIANAERSIFGTASGIITYSKYKTIRDYEEILNRELQERMTNNNGILDGVA